MSNKVSAQDLKNIQSILGNSKQVAPPSVPAPQPQAQPQPTQPSQSNVPSSAPVVQSPQLETQKVLEMLKQQSNGNLNLDLNQLNELVNGNNQNGQAVSQLPANVTPSTVFNIMGMNIPKNYVYIGLFIILAVVLAYMWYSGKEKEEKEENEKENSDAKYNKLIQNQMTHKLEDDQEHILKMRELALRKKMMMEKEMAMRMQKMKEMEQQKQEENNNNENVEAEE